MRFLLVLIFAFYANAHDQKNGVKVEQLVKSTKSWDGKTLPKYNEGQPEVKILKITIPAGTTLPVHQHPVINAGYLLEGELTVISDQKETLVLKEGDTLVELVGKWHYGVNKGQRDAVILVFYAGIEDTPTTVKK